MPEPQTPNPAPQSLLPGLDLAAFHETLRNARQKLLDERNEHGWWTGELSSSALSTATAIVAMELARRNGCEAARNVTNLIERGLRWLIEKQNEDGGWGDTDKSKSNISTTMLVWGAMGLISNLQSPISNLKTRIADLRLEISDLKTSVERCETWLAHHAGSLEIPALVEAVMKRYGKDRTFSVPILTMCALCGRLGDPEDRATWKWVKQLPFEFAAFPRSWFKVLNLQVVSYALPALIAIGMVRHHHRATWNPFARLARWLTKRRVMRLLESIQPPNGGFLEATPLTSFVSMSLAACGFASHPVVTRGITFIINSARADGSWAIDTNLATWVTTLSVNALAAGGSQNLHDYLNEQEREVIRDWLLNQQYKEVHPYTGAALGGWAWTDLPGGVPDADDTSGAVIALHALDEDGTGPSRERGLVWLKELANRDGGTPTFCAGWGQLPFDRSSNDITAHFLRAEREAMSGYSAAALRPLNRAAAYLQRVQGADGSWMPLWFGNQDRADESNPIYGTSRVICATSGIAALRASTELGTQWLIANQSVDGGWGGGVGTRASIEETALAVEGMVVALSDATPQAAIARGVNWLIEQTVRGTSFPPSPIGFYFAKLWYYEKLYPIIFTVAALERVAALLERERET